MEISSIEQYRRADIIIDATCKVGNIDYLQFLSSPRTTEMSALRGVCCMVAWEYGVHARKMARLIHRTRSNIINQSTRYRNWLKNNDILTTNIYHRIKSEIKDKI